MKRILQNIRFLPLLLALILVACSTEKNTFVNRNMHNLTAHYNVYFNGNESLKAGLYKVEHNLENDYTKILPVFKESLPKAAELVTTDMDIAVEKATKLIKFHSMTKPPKNAKKSAKKRKKIKDEYNKWVDDAYFLMGKGYFYKKDLFRANATFSLIIRKYKNEPQKYDAYLWLIRCLAEAERYTEAREIISSLEGDDYFPKKLEGELAIVAADLNLKQQRYDDAIAFLNIGIKKIKGNKRKTRYTFILAQLYQETKKNEQALLAYRQVIRRRPDYEMLFNARINSAKVFSGESNVAELKKELNKMIRKKRNATYLDQIYYALGNIAYGDGKIKDATNLYKKSVSVSTTNTYQRALSSITLGELFFSQREYIPSGMYYDSAMVLIDENYPNYEVISKQANSLSKLVDNLLRVSTEDSLQALAKLSDIERNALIERWITAEKTKQEQIANSEAEGEYAGAYNRSTSSRMNIRSSGSGWYFYNPSTVAYGKKDFQRIWGERKNEDNWRRSNKKVSEFDESGEPIEENLADMMEKEVAARADDPTTKEYYLQDIPLTDSLLAASHAKIRDALYNAGVIFKSDFNDFERSVECFTELNKRYPNNQYTLPSYFNLYDLYQTMAKPDSSMYFRNLIIKNYPESNYAKYLLNPNFFIEMEARIDSLNSLYNMAFNAYKYHQFDKASRLSKQVLSLGPDSLLIPKVQFIRTISESVELPKKQFSDSLLHYIELYPETETAALAKQIQALLNTDQLNNYQELVNTGYLNDVIKNIEIKNQGKNTEQTEVTKWDKEEELLHYFIIAIPNDADIDINRLKFDIANYNIDHFTTRDFDIETENLNNETKLIVVRNLSDKESAMIYFLSIIRKPEVFKTLAGKKFLNFIISNNNFREMLSDRSYDDYLQFFVKNYSSYIKGNFSEEELESPEALIAKMKESENEFKEQGEFVVIETADTSFKPKPSAQEIYSIDYNEPHLVAIHIAKPAAKTGFLMRSLVQYNTANYRNSRLRVLPSNKNGASFIFISQFAGAVDAKKYLDDISEKKDLFSSLKSEPYDLFMITAKNMTTMEQTGKIKEYLEFYKKYYVVKRIKAATNTTSIDTNPESPKESTSTETKEEDKVETPVEVPVESKKDVVEEVKPSDEITSPIENTANVDTATTSIEDKTTITESEVKQETVEPIKVENVFNTVAEAPHNLIILIPAQGYNSMLLQSYLKRLNAINFNTIPLVVTLEDYDNITSFIRVKGLPNEAKAKEYLQTISKDSRIGMSLRNVNYKQYIITDENLDILKEKKNIAEYQKFHNESYGL